MKLSSQQQEQARTLIKGLSLFADCTDEPIRAFVANLQFSEFAKGKVVLVEQEISRTLYILMKGSVSIWHRSGGEKNLVAQLQAPDFFGERSMLTERPASALVKAEENSQLVTLDRKAFNDVLLKHPALRSIIQKNLTQIAMKRPALSRPPSSAPTDTL